MLCYMHALDSDEVQAVATCEHCGVGLCLEHLAQSHAPSVGGTRLDCSHPRLQPDEEARWTANRDVRSRA